MRSRATLITHMLGPEDGGRRDEDRIKVTLTGFTQSIAHGCFSQPLPIIFNLLGTVQLEA